MNNDQPTFLELIGWALLFLALPIGLISIGYLAMHFYS
jgi:hypothetical protein